MKMINVLFFTHYAEMYGANYSTLYLMTELKEKYNVNPFIIMPRRGPLITKLREREIPYLCINFKLWMCNSECTQPKIEAWLEMKGTNSDAIRKIEVELQKRKFCLDVVVSASSMMNIGMQYALLKKKKHIWFIRECNEQYKFSNIYPKYIARWWWKRSSKIICISRFGLNEFKNTYGRIGNEIVLYNGVDTDIEERKPILSQDSGNVRFCIVGLIAENKGQYFVVKGFEKIYNMGYANFELYIVGDGDITEIRKINHLLKNNCNFAAKVKLMGYCSDVKKLLRSMDVGIMASYKETFGRTTVEYMMSGMPVIASASGANEEIVLDGETGYIYEFNKETDFINKIKKCLEYPEKLSVLGKNGKVRAQKYFTKEENARGFYEILKNSKDTENKFV